MCFFPLSRHTDLTVPGLGRAIGQRLTPGYQSVVLLVYNCAALTSSLMLTNNTQAHMQCTPTPPAPTTHPASRRISSSWGVGGCVRRPIAHSNALCQVNRSLSPHPPPVSQPHTHTHTPPLYLLPYNVFSTQPHMPLNHQIPDYFSVGDDQSHHYLLPRPTPCRPVSPSF